MNKDFEEAVSRLSRRSMLRGGAFALGAAFTAPILASCATSGGSGGGASSGPISAGGTVATTSTSGAPALDPKNPFGIESGSTSEIVIFNGGFGDQYGKDAAGFVEALGSGVKYTVTSTVDIQPQLQPRILAGDPPDCFDNSGAQNIPMKTLIDAGALEPLDDILTAPAMGFDGMTVSETLIDPQLLSVGLYNNKMYAMNFVLSVYGVYYSKKMFDDNGWTAPKTWDEMIALAPKAKEKNIYMFSFGGQNASTYFAEMCITMATKTAGKEVLEGLEALNPDAWSHPALQQAFGYLDQLIKGGYIHPGDTGIKHTEAQAEWVKGESVFYPSGSWIANEMRDVTPADYAMVGMPVPAMTTSDAMPYEALHAGAGEPYVVPAKGKNVAAGKEFIRALLSKEGAANFVKLTDNPTIVKVELPADASEFAKGVSAMAAAAGANTFNWQYSQLNGLNKDEIGAWTPFLAGQSDVATLTKQLQDIMNKAKG
ncbi:N-acetylglucosamine/diacetylchitobiose ABC transporter substrate-binding protein [Micrococcales bacterium 31B]|nr:N-acetylglucosamine/diacetylchitobiose ABC transporter substrate-binding protein [Micrococcales bacterium 31B]